MGLSLEQEVSYLRECRDQWKHQAEAMFDANRSLRDGLERYGAHRPECDAVSDMAWTGLTECSCGLDKLRELLASTGPTDIGMVLDTTQVRALLRALGVINPDILGWPQVRLTARSGERVRLSMRKESAQVWEPIET